MGSLERQPLHKAPLTNAEVLPIGENAVQLALAKHWAKKQEITVGGNEIMNAWIQSGYAEKYRNFADTYQMRVDLSDEKAIADLLDEIEITLH